MRRTILFAFVNDLLNHNCNAVFRNGHIKYLPNTQIHSKCILTKLYTAHNAHTHTHTAHKQAHPIKSLTYSHNANNTPAEGWPSQTIEDSSSIECKSGFSQSYLKCLFKQNGIYRQNGITEVRCDVMRENSFLNTCSVRFAC